MSDAWIKEFFGPDYRALSREEMMAKLEQAPRLPPMEPVPLSEILAYQRTVLDSMQSDDDLIVLTKGVDVAQGTVPEPFDGLSYIRDVAAGRK